MAWYSTVLLAVLYWLSILDRTIISLMVDPIKNDIGISDVQFGMLHGLAFAVTFSLFGLAAGMLADRYQPAHRRLRRRGQSGPSPPPPAAWRGNSGTCWWPASGSAPARPGSTPARPR